MDSKLIAFYLPQFHTFPENDKWWGAGFTEWTNVKRAKPLYKKHNQPREPLGLNYYDLSKLNPLLAQFEMAKKYGIYGFCFYHYWFGGKLLLNKPVEMVRDYEGEKLNYCFCWANEPWARTWDGHDTDVLIPQNYGGKKDWENHFIYLKSFFADPYYIKINNAPLLVLYRCNSIPDCNEMITYWDRRCIEEGFSGIYIVEEINAFQDRIVCSESKAVLDFEPSYVLKKGRNLYDKGMDKAGSVIFNLVTGNRNLINSYEAIWNRIIRYDKKRNFATKVRFFGAFVDWDNTPRKGKNGGRIVIGGNPHKFGSFLYKQKMIAKKSNVPYIFINAWNEWGEGAYLEPDTRFEYRYLEEIKRIWSENDK